MNPLARRIQRVYLSLTFGNTLAASLIWGINTLFLLDAGLSNLGAFAANAFFTAGMVLFEVPTGIVADVWGRRTSFLLGTITLSASTLLYWLMWQTQAPFWQWAAASLLIGLGFTFFSGAVEAWLVDAMNFAKYKGNLESVFGRGQMAMGAAMLSGSVGGGVIAQTTSLGVPYLIRGAILLAMFGLAFSLMRDLGFKPQKRHSPLQDVRRVFRASLQHGLKNPPVRWVMLAAPFSLGVSFYAFYALQPYLLELYGNKTAYSIAGLAAAIVACAQMVGGMSASKIRGLFNRRTTALIFGVISSVVVLLAVGLTGSFWAAIALVSLWSLIFAAIMPIRQAYINSLIPSDQRATVLSFDSLMGNTGGVVIQPTLGRAADVWSYGSSFIGAAAFQALALPFLLKARLENSPTDTANGSQNKA